MNQITFRVNSIFDLWGNTHEFLDLIKSFMYIL